MTRQACLSPICPVGRLWGECQEPSHWLAEEGRQEPPYDKGRIPMTTSHLLQTAGYNLGHAIIHTDSAMKLAKKTKDKGDGETDLEFNLDHASHHLSEAQDHLARLVKHIKEHYPAEAGELDKLEKVEVV